MAQQTAVEWLENELDKWSNGKFYIPTYILEKAKQIEKETIKQAFEDGESNIDWNGGTINMNGAEQYYNETYGE